MTKYKIIRFFKNPNRKAKVIRKNLTLAEAKQHCNRPDTRKAGVWFDGFDKQ